MKGIDFFDVVFRKIVLGSVVMNRFVPSILLVVVLVVFQVLTVRDSGSWANIQPLSGLLFCAVAYYGFRHFWVPALALAWVMSFFLVSARNGVTVGWDLLAVALGAAAVIGVACLARKKQGIAWKLSGVVGASLAFFVVTNFLSWLTLPDYPKTLIGLLQAEWLGAPHHAVPTWLFLRNELLASVGFWALFVVGNGLVTWRTEEKKQAQTVA